MTVRQRWSVAKWGRRAAGAMLAAATVAVAWPGTFVARELARHLRVPLLDALVRARKTEAQADLPASRRTANVRGAFTLARGVQVEGLTLVLVDDVSTTGSTLNACALPLLDAGALEVRALTAAKATLRSAAGSP